MILSLLTLISPAVPTPPDLLNPVSDIMVAGNSLGKVMVWSSDFTERYNVALANYNSSFQGSTQRAPARGAGTATVGDHAYLIGGGDSGTPFGTVAMWDMSTTSSDSFALLAPLPTPRSELGASAIGSVLYAVGGFGGSWNELECADSAAATLAWEKGTGLPTPRYGLVAEAVGGTLYTFGGNAWHDPNSVHVEAFTPTAGGSCGDGTWATKAPIPLGVSFPATAVVGTDIYIMGGDLTSGTTSSLQSGIVQIYHTSTNTWSNGTTVLTPPRSHFSAAYVSSTILAFGGTTGTGNFQHDLAKGEIIALN
jgi:hypothetical protein